MWWIAFAIAVEISLAIVATVLVLLVVLGLQSLMATGMISEWVGVFASLAVVLVGGALLFLPLLLFID